MKPKRVPRLWCALQGLLPLDACLAAQHGELAWPREKTVTLPSDEPKPWPTELAEEKRDDLEFRRTQ